MTKNIIMLLVCVIHSTAVISQNTFKAVIKDSETKETLIGATAVLEGTTIGSTSDINGIIIINDVPNGEQEIQFRFTGYGEFEQSFVFPLPNNEPIEIYLSSEAGELGEVVISSTRSTRTIEDIPTRVEFIAGEELEEKGNMKSGDIRMLLNESTGIQTQQTSATSANASIRIQGLDGRYTQILKDGFPLYSGASSGLGLLQIPPLDLKQVELIKGSASTLYGGGAIAGLVNLVSKTPDEEKELKFHLNGSSGKGYDISGFYGKRNEKIGTTIFATHNRNWAYDPADIGLSAIPKFERYTFNPKLFVYCSDISKLIIGLNSTIENRLGGDMRYIEGKSDSIHQYFEQNKTKRYSSQISFDHAFNDSLHMQVKYSIGYFNRQIEMPDYKFEGLQIASFGEASYSKLNEKTEWIAGLNLWTDNFNEEQQHIYAPRDYQLTTIGAFIQNTWKISTWFNLESGFRTDYVVDYGYSYLPRLSALFKITPKFTSRIGAGLGYKPPTIFTEESEQIQYKGVVAINPDINKLEKSYGMNADFNYRTTFGNDKFTFSINELLFYTNIDNPLLLQRQVSGLYQFINSTGFIQTQGSETNIKLGYSDVKLFIGYTFTDTKIKDNSTSIQNPLTPKHRLNTILMYEIEERWKVGLEAYYFSKQKLNDNTFGKQYVVFGFMAEKLWETFSIYINFENFTDTRQTRFDTIYTGTITNPDFRDIYAPLDGFLINGGIKFKL